MNRIKELQKSKGRNGMERAQKKYIDGKKPLETIISDLTEYLPLANLVKL